VEDPRHLIPTQGPFKPSCQGAFFLRPERFGVRITHEEDVIAGSSAPTTWSLEARGFAQSVREAVDRAAQRSRELAEEFGATPAWTPGSSR
jgi:hypothetical protein